jgi:hypothetical protein
LLHRRHGRGRSATACAELITVRCHTTGKKLSAHDCTLACVKDGGEFVFVSKGKVFEIANQELADLKEHAGQPIKLTGELSSDEKSITVSRLEPQH